MRILIIEDDTGVVEAITFALESLISNVEVTSTNRGIHGVELVETLKPDVIIVDIGLPDINGFEVIKEIRFFSTIPILVLTCRAEETDVVRSLGLGANDYLVKPPRQMELVARLKNLTQNKHPDIIKYGSLVLNQTLRTLSFQKIIVHLTTIESIIIFELLLNAPVTVTYSSFSEAIWGEDNENNNHKLKVHIHHLKHKIALSGMGAVIHNRSGLGYYIDKS
jgi:two-component system response regulator VicR